MDEVEIVGREGKANRPVSQAYTVESVTSLTVGSSRQSADQDFPESPRGSYAD